MSLGCLQTARRHASTMSLAQKAESYMYALPILEQHIAVQDSSYHGGRALPGLRASGQLW